ncbi:MAG: hypothetical protein AAGF92_17680 [Myxococcota bacterium]
MLRSFGAATRLGATLRWVASAVALVIVPLVGFAFFGMPSPFFVIFLVSGLYFLWVFVAHGVALVRSLFSKAPKEFQARRWFLAWFLLGFAPAALWLLGILLESWVASTSSSSDVVTRVNT